MKFGVFYEMQLPRPWTADSDYRLFNDALDQLELADRLGYDYAWEVEHHFLEEYSQNIDQVVLLNQAGRNTHQDICASLELFARDVMPEFHANIPAHEAWKGPGAGRRHPSPGSRRAKPDDGLRKDVARAAR